MNYEKMSDFEINSAVYNLTKKLGFSLDFLGCDTIKWSKKGEKDITTGKVEYSKNGLIDYCNNPSDAWTIIMENFISIDQHHNGSYIRVLGYCDAGLISMQCLRKDVLRTAMIVFLMMQEAKRG